MGQRSPNARLQDDILLFLIAEHKADTVAELARNLGAPRPSVSRAINSLASGGFVSKESGEWNLTETGEEEARQLRERGSPRGREAALLDEIEKLKTALDEATANTACFKGRVGCDCKDVHYERLGQ